MPDYRGYIGNCLIGGESFGQIGGKKVRNLIHLALDGYDVTLVQDPNLVTANFRNHDGETIGTTNLLIRDLPEAEFERAQIITRNAAELLSLATCSDVRHYGYYFPHGEVIESSSSLSGETRYFWPLLNTRSGEHIREYLVQCWAAYSTLREPRKLVYAFYYFVQSNRNVPIELQLVVTFVLLENLKHSFAHGAGYPYIKGRFRGHRATSSSPGEPKTFEELLTEMFQAVGMSVPLRRIVSLRNEMVHAGLSELSATEKRRIYQDCQDATREYLLRLLGYRGEYYPFSRRVPSVLS